MKDFFADRRPHDGLTYEEYRRDWKTRKARSPEPGMDKDERKMLHYLKYNWERQAHVHDAYELSEDLQQALDAVEEEQIWMVLTEPWCGDSAFLLPVIADAAAEAENVTLRILPRDEHLDVMDQYLTGGSRSIPKLVAFAAEGPDEGRERFVWGPRPEGAARRFAELREQDLPKEQMIEQLVGYYEDGGWKEVDAELAEAVKKAGTKTVQG